MKTSYFLGEGKKSRIFYNFSAKTQKQIKNIEKIVFPRYFDQQGHKKVFINEKMAKTLP